MTVKETENAFSKGLEEVVAAESAICFIDGKNSKLVYRGYLVHELCEKSSFEETAYLLLFGKLPKKEELLDFSQKLASERDLPKELLAIIAGFPKQANPMTTLRTAVSHLGLFDGEADDKSMDANVRKAFRLIAKIPSMVAAIDRARKALPYIAPKKDAFVSTAANFMYMLKARDASALEVKMLDKYFILLAEHDLNASTFAAVVTASTLSDVYSAVTSAIGTLKGDLHGSANSRAMESLIAIGELNKVESYVEDAIRNKKKLMGFGHRVYKGPDPRADDLRKMAKALAEGNPEQAKWYAISEKFEKMVWEKKQLHCNVDFYSASVLYTIGIPVDLFTPMFAVSRVSGWTAHLLEQYADNRLMRPVSQYTGLSNQSYTAIEKR